jgi:hypothetical protein
MARPADLLARLGRGPNVCPRCGSRVSPFAAGCAICSADLPPYEERRRKGLGERVRTAVRRRRDG